MRVSAVLVNHNSNGTILKSIQALLDQEYLLEKIVVVDNGSTDGGPEQIRQTFPHVQVLELGENRGLSSARNTGLNLINSDLVLLVDDDVCPSQGALRLMVDAHRATNAMVICPRIVLYPEIETIQCDGASLHFAGTLSLRHAYQPVSDHIPELSMTNGFIGACLLFDHKALMELGNFDEDYFFYFEDMELSYRLLALGYKIYCEERAVVFHERGVGTENLSFRGAGQYPARRAYFNLRHRWLTMLIHYQARTLWLLSPALMLYEAAAFIESLRRGWLIEYIRALFSLVIETGSIMKRRQRWQSQRKVMDGDILSGGPLPFSHGFVEKGNLKFIRLLNNLLNSYWNMVKRWL